MFTDDQGERHETREELSIERKLDLILDKFKDLESAFARNEDGSVDFDGHRRYHEAMIRAAEEQAAVWRELKMDIAKKGAWGLLIIVLGLIAVGVQTKFGFGVK
jgi:lipopolysaccharide export LptBFGC system permease protein LptF